MCYIELNPKAGQEAAIDNFATKLLRAFGYDNDNSRVQSRRFTIDSAEASALDSGTNFWVR
jgi:hypothetical protein